MTTRLRPAARRQVVERLRNMAALVRLRISIWNNATQIYDETIAEPWKFRKSRPDELLENRIGAWRKLDLEMADLQDRAQRVRDMCTEAIELLRK